MPSEDTSEANLPVAPRQPPQAAEDLSGAGDPLVPTLSPPPSAGDGSARVTALVQAHFEFVWRVVRRFGVPESAADDAAQQVFMVLARRIDQVEEGAERTFLFRTALNVAGDAGRARARNRERAEDGIEAVIDPGLSPEDTIDRTRALEMIQDILLGMDEPERVVFVLFELEGVSAREIAEMVEIPAGTVASRLRRAREYFHGEAKRLRSRDRRST